MNGLSRQVKALVAFPLCVDSWRVPDSVSIGACARVYGRRGYAGVYGKGWRECLLLDLDRDTTLHSLV